ncbi:THAP domain-containing protein 2-like isoform X2 [Clupea harengus]|uniref:THAP domain-containing protein 2-like isoform X2 n=1 Tax=Clupea harengus TaxID=7950 RepID=A0A8M1KDG6_CLUHA|nr:THAP domain-containing protein 2-like isoform X2 [Clupea harengus]
MSYCCVPECRSYKRKESGKRKTFHRFPVNTAIRREWVVKIRRDVGQHFKIANNTRVCSDHFPDESFTKTLCGIRKLKEGVVPSLFTWSSIKPGRRTIVRTASHVATATCGEDARGDESCHSMGQDLQEDIACTSSEVETSLPHSDHDYTQRPLSLEEQLQEACKSIARQEEEISTLRGNQFLLKRFQCDDKQIQFYTGFRDYNTLKAVFTDLQPTACLVYLHKSTEFNTSRLN